MNITDGDGIREFVERETGGSYDPRSVAIGLLCYRGNRYEILAGIVYEQCNGASVVCHMAAKYITRQFLRFNAKYAFNQLGVKKIIAPIAEDNLQMRKLAAKMGFRCGAVLEGCDPNGDLMLFTLAKEDCRFLGEKYGKTKAARVA